MSFIHENTPVTPEQARLLAFRDVASTLRMIDGVLLGYLIDPLGAVTFRFMQTLSPDNCGYGEIKHKFPEREVVVSRVCVDGKPDTYKTVVLNEGTVEMSMIKLADENGECRCESVREDVGILKKCDKVQDFAKITEGELITVDQKTTASEPRSN